MKNKLSLKQNFDSEVDIETSDNKDGSVTQKSMTQLKMGKSLFGVLNPLSCIRTSDPEIDVRAATSRKHEKSSHKAADSKINLIAIEDNDIRDDMVKRNSHRIVKNSKIIKESFNISMEMGLDTSFEMAIKSIVTPTPPKEKGSATLKKSSKVKQKPFFGINSLFK